MISEEQKRRRRLALDSTIGSSAMKGQFLDAATLKLFDQFAEGELTDEELSTAIDIHVADMLIAMDHEVPAHLRSR